MFCLYKHRHETMGMIIAWPLLLLLVSCCSSAMRIRLASSTPGQFHVSRTGPIWQVSHIDGAYLRFSLSGSQLRLVAGHPKHHMYRMSYTQVGTQRGSVPRKQEIYLLPSSRAISIGTTPEAWIADTGLDCGSRRGIKRWLQERNSSDLYSAVVVVTRAHRSATTGSRGGRRRQGRPVGEGWGSARRPTPGEDNRVGLELDDGTDEGYLGDLEDSSESLSDRDLLVAFDQIRV